MTTKNDNIMIKIEGDRKKRWELECIKRSKPGAKFTMTDLITTAVEQFLDPKVRIVTTLEASSPEALQAADIQALKREATSQIDAAARVTQEEIHALLNPDDQAAHPIPHVPTDEEIGKRLAEGMAAAGADNLATHSAKVLEKKPRKRMQKVKDSKLAEYLEAVKDLPPPAKSKRRQSKGISSAASSTAEAPTESQSSGDDDWLNV